MLKSFSVALLCLAVSSAAVAGPMTPGERQRLVAHFDTTEAWLEDEVKNLSDAQLTFKMTPTSWSVEEVVMHLVPDDHVALASAHHANSRGEGSQGLP